jgi:hypothetical protein
VNVNQYKAEAEIIMCESSWGVLQILRARRVLVGRVLEIELRNRTNSVCVFVQVAWDWVHQV